jgi:hypothetical protein
LFASDYLNLTLCCCRSSSEYHFDEIKKLIDFEAEIMNMDSKEQGLNMMYYLFHSYLKPLTRRMIKIRGIVPYMEGIPQLITRHFEGVKMDLIKGSNQKIGWSVETREEVFNDFIVWLRCLIIVMADLCNMKETNLSLHQCYSFKKGQDHTFTFGVVVIECTK